MSRRVTANLIAFVLLFGVMLWWAVNNIISFDFIERPYSISAEFPVTAGVNENSEVAYLGVNYGSVSRVEPMPGKVRITMDIDRGKEIPAGSIARIFRKSAIGEPYIDFNPPEDFRPGGPVIEPGDLIPVEQTRVPLEFSEMLRAASRVLSAVDPEQTRSLVHELAAALDGRGEDLRSLTLDADQVLATLADRTELLDRLSTNSTRLTRTVAEHRQELSSALVDLAALAESLRAVNGSTEVLLDRGAELLSETADLVGDVKRNLDCALGDLDIVLEEATEEENLDALAASLDRLPSAFGLVYNTRDSEPGGVWVRVDLIAPTENPAEQYVPPHELPAVPEIPACDSSLTPRAASGGVVPTAATDAVVAEVGVPAAGDQRAALAVYGLAAVVAAVGVRRRGRT